MLFVVIKDVSPSVQTLETRLTNEIVTVPFQTTITAARRSITELSKTTHVKRHNRFKFKTLLNRRYEQTTAQQRMEKKRKETIPQNRHPTTRGPSSPLKDAPTRDASFSRKFLGTMVHRDLVSPKSFALTALTLSLARSLSYNFSIFTDTRTHTRYTLTHTQMILRV